ncbi:MAG: Fic family protein [Candidatus Eremiobacteraeota bacterium]|nr:Fic family protein [Candidatus Eremiobacteraeota bacterium]
MAVTKHDLFLAIAASGSIDEADLKQMLFVTDERQFMQDLQFLAGDKLIDKQGTKLSYVKNPSSEVLFDLLTFAVTYDINYNNYFSSPMLILLEQTYLQKYFGLHEVQQVDQMKRINISILRKDGFIIVVQPRPFLGKIIQNSFFDYLLKVNKRNPTPMDKKKKDIPVETLLVEKLMKKQLQAKMKSSDPSSMPEIQYLEDDDPSNSVFINPTKEQRAIKARISLRNRETFNVTFKENLKRAEQKMLSNVNSRVRLSKAVVMDYHKILMNDPAIGGLFRKENVQVAGNPYFKTAHFNKVEHFLDKLLERYNKTTFKNMPEVVKFGAFLHNELQFTHPFIDGNSRLTRLVMDHFFRENNAPIYEIPVSYISRYSAITKGSKRRDDNQLFELLKEIFLYIICKS